VLVQDNLNTHKPASLYEAFATQPDRKTYFSQKGLAAHYAGGQCDFSCS
jgi:hypothetical protein